jgi:hypothetical protein
MGEVVEALVALWSVADSEELRNQVFHLPSLVRHVFPNRAR